MKGGPDISPPRPPAVQHLETYWAILAKVKGSALRLTKYDDEIYEHLQKDFPDFDPAATIDENEMKSKAGKERWRKFMMAYDKRVDDYNFGTILRTSPGVEYEEHTTIFGMVPCAMLMAHCLHLTCSTARSGLKC